MLHTRIIDIKIEKIKSSNAEDFIKSSKYEPFSFFSAFFLEIALNFPFFLASNMNDKFLLRISSFFEGILQ